MEKLKPGFTLLEISLVVVLIAIMIAITTPLAIDAVIKADLNSSHESLYISLLRAQKLSRVQERGQQWLLCIDNTNKSYIIAAGSCSSPVYKETIKFSSHVTITASPSLNVSFYPITGKPQYNVNNSFIITLSSGGSSKVININEAGVINKTVNN
jgi:prepilin-type N-terminal cleavage/methylation domain-containing protein